MDTTPHSTSLVGENSSMLLTLPFELKQIIIGFCNKSGLSALSSAHSTLTEAAEEALYQRVHIYTAQERFLTCLQTLSDNSHKAGLVRCLIMEYHNPAAFLNDASRREASNLTLLARALKNMQGLYDLNVSCWSEGRGDLSGLEPITALNDVISVQHFRLRTLYCNPILDLVRIIKNQPTLQTVGIYSTFIPGDMIEPIIQLQESKISMPNVFGLGREGRTLQWNTFTVFPEISLDYESGMLISKLEESFLNHRSYRCRIGHQSAYVEFYIFLSDFSNIDAIKTLLESLSKNFSHISFLDIYLREDCEIPFKYLEGPLSKFSELSELAFESWDYRGNPNKSLGPISSQIQIPHTIEGSIWTACPKLSSIIIGSIDFVRPRGV